MKKIFLYCSVLAMLSLSSCKKDEATPDPVKQTTTSTSAAQSVKVSNAKLVPGNIPAASTDPSAPVLLQENTQISAIVGKKVGFTPNIELGGSYEKVLVQIDGQSSYYVVDAPVAGSNLRTSRTSESQKPITLELPANLAPGNFCFTYCVVDNLGRYSNPVKVCVDVKAFGGEGSATLIGSWKLVSIKEKDGEFFKLNEFLNEKTFAYCYNDDKDEIDSTELNVNASFAKYDFSFLENGVTTQDYKSTISYEEYDCETKIKSSNSNSDEGIQKGAWSYTKAENKLILLFDENTGSESVDYEAVEFKVLENTASKLTIIDQVDFTTYFFEK